jgi:hypothetical protein
MTTAVQQHGAHSRAQYLSSKLPWAAGSKARKQQAAYAKLIVSHQSQRLQGRQTP